MIDLCPLVVFMYVTIDGFSYISSNKNHFDPMLILLVICSSPVAYTLSLYVYIHEAFIILSCYLNCGLT